MKAILTTLVMVMAMAGFSAQVSAEEAAAVEQVATVININTADAEAIAGALSGVGLKKAEAIVAYREANGSFKSLEEVTDVKGIGAKTLEKNAASITF